MNVRWTYCGNQLKTYVNQAIMFYALNLYSACMLSHLSRVWLCATLWTVALQVPLSVGFSRQEHWSRLPSPPPGDLPNPGIEPQSLMSTALASEFFTTSAPWETQTYIVMYVNYFSIKLEKERGPPQREDLSAECRRECSFGHMLCGCVPGKAQDWKEAEIQCNTRFVFRLL